MKSTLCFTLSGSLGQRREVGKAPVEEVEDLVIGIEKALEIAAESKLSGAKHGRAVGCIFTGQEGSNTA